MYGRKGVTEWEEREKEQGRGGGSRGWRENRES